MTKTSEARRHHLTIYAVVFLTGFTFLIYEVSWNRLLSLVLGTTVTASTIVLASFMAGFGSGAYVWGRRAGRNRQPGRMLSLLLGGVGLLGVLDYFVIESVIPGMYSALSGGLAPGLLELLVFVPAMGVLFAQTFLMGGVFPIACKIAADSDDTVASTLGRLYAIETLGSTIGGLAAGFVFLGFLGQRNTVWLAVIVNVALAVWLYARRESKSLAEAAAGTGAAVANENEDKKRRPHKAPAFANVRQIALVGAFICGFAMLGLQVLWIRAFRVYLTNTSYTFALVASLVILGLFVGSSWFRRRGDRIKDHRAAMLRTILFMGAVTGVGLLPLVFMPQLLMFPFQSVLSSPWARALLLPLVASLLIVFPPSVFSGYAFPLACRMYSSGRASIGADVGVVLLVNTAGCVIGPLVTTFILLPLLGVAVAILFTLALLAGVALFIIQRWKTARTDATLKVTLYAATAILLLVVILRPQIEILPPSLSRPDSEVLFYRESVEGTLSVGRDKRNPTSSLATFVNNSAVIGSSYDAIKAVKMVGHFPFLLGSDRKEVLVIGFGIGVTTSAIASHPEVKSIECVELVPGLKDAAVFYRDLNNNVVADPRLKIISGDGRHYLQRTAKKYDLISCDPTHPILGSGNLYTRDYFDLVREHLKPGGVVSQYLPLHKLRTEDFVGVISTFQAVFPNSAVWLGHYHAVLLGSLDSLKIDFADWSRRVAGLGTDPNFYIDPYHLAATLALDASAIERLGAQDKINTDDRSYTEFFAPSCLDESNLGANLAYLIANRAAIGTVFTDIQDSTRMARYLRGNQLMTESLLDQLNGDNQRGLQALQEACRVNPEDQEYPFLIRLNY